MTRLLLSTKARIAASCIAALAAVSSTSVALAQVDCAKSPTFMRKIPGGHELVFHPQCEPPALKADPAGKQPRMAPVSGPAPNPVPVAGITPTNVSHTPAASTAAADGTAQPRMFNGQKSYGNRVRVQSYARIRRR